MQMGGQINAITHSVSGSEKHAYYVRFGGLRAWIFLTQIQHLPIDWNK
jgi:hypothetical protein